MCLCEWAFLNVFYGLFTWSNVNPTDLGKVSSGVPGYYFLKLDIFKRKKSKQAFLIHIKIRSPDANKMLKLSFYLSRLHHDYK